MTAKPRQDLPARAFRLSIELLRLQQQTRSSDAMAHIGMQMFRAGSAIGASIEEGRVQHRGSSEATASYLERSLQRA
jgi:four helix bundle protein